jgi:hypothetical protein
MSAGPSDGRLVALAQAASRKPQALRGGVRRHEPYDPERLCRIDEATTSKLRGARPLASHSSQPGLTL